MADKEIKLSLLLINLFSIVLTLLHPLDMHKPQVLLNKLLYICHIQIIALATYLKWYSHHQKKSFYFAYATQVNDCHI